MPENIRKFLYRGQNTLLLPAEREAFAVLEEWIAGIAQELDLPAKAKNKLFVVADEIFTNIASYGYPEQLGTVTVEILFDLEKLELCMIFTDTGIAYNPLEAPEPDTESPLAKRKIGGLGISLVKRMMDTVEYRREKDRNILTLRKRVEAGGGGA